MYIYDMTLCVCATNCSTSVMHGKVCRVREYDNQYTF